MTRINLAARAIVLVASVGFAGAGHAQTANWNNGQQQNYIGISFANSRSFNPARDDGYVHYGWRCPTATQLRQLGDAIVNRTLLGVMFGTYNGTYVVTAKWTGSGTLQPNSLDQVLLSFEYNESSNPKVKLRNTCAALFPQNMNYNAPVALTIGLAKSQDIGISDALAGPIAAIGKISGLYLASTPGIFSDLTSTFQVITQNKANLNAFINRFGQSIQSQADYTFEPDVQIVSVAIGDYVFRLQKTWIPSVVYRGNSPSTVSEQLFLERTGINVATTKSSISSMFEADIDNTSLFAQRCSAYRDKLNAMGLTDTDAVLLLWAELANHPKLASAACFTVRDVQLLTALKMPPPYKGAF